MNNIVVFKKSTKWRKQDCFLWKNNINSQHKHNFFILKLFCNFNNLRNTIFGFQHMINIILI